MRPFIVLSSFAAVKLFPLYSLAAMMEMLNVDWAALWRQARQQKNWTAKEPGDWDKKAAAFAERTTGLAYAEQFVTLMAPPPDCTVLDVGCGPGTLALPLASCCQSVTALDFFAGMLAILEQRAAEQGLTN